MNQKQKDVILLLLLVLLTIGLIVVGILIYVKVIPIPEFWGHIVNFSSLFISQATGIWPKVIHFRKVKAEVKKVESIEEKIEERIKKEVEKINPNRNYMK